MMQFERLGFLAVLPTVASRSITLALRDYTLTWNTWSICDHCQLHQLATSFRYTILRLVGEELEKLDLL